MQRLTCRPFIFCLVLGFLLSTGQVVQASCGSAKVEIEFPEEDMTEAPEDDVKRVTKLATGLAWKKYTQTLSAEYAQAYIREEPAILRNLNFFILSKEKSEPKLDVDSEPQTVSIKVCLTVDKNRFKTALKIKPKAPKPAPIATGTGSVIVTLFIARQATEQQEFKTRTFAKSRSSRKGKSKEMARASGGKAVSSTASKQSRSSEAGGSSTYKADKTSYKVLSSKDLDAQMTTFLTKAGYEPVDYADIEDPECGRAPKKSDVSKVFMSKDDMPSRMWRKARKAARKCEAKFFARGTMTAGIGKPHDSGMKEVFVKVRGFVYDVSRRLPRKVGAIGPITIPGLGPDDFTALDDALVAAGKEAAKEIVLQLQNKGIR